MLAIMLMLSASCKKQTVNPNGKVTPTGPSTEEVNQQQVINYAKVCFYTKQPVLLLRVTVTGVNTYYGNQLSDAPTCNDTTLHWVSLPAGDYNYTAEDYHQQRFKGSFKVAEGECAAVELK